MSIEERLYNAGFEDVVYFPDYDEECIIGIDSNNRAVYSFEKMIRSLMNGGMDDMDAIEWIEYNTIRALPYIDNQTDGHAPIIMYDADWLGL